ncbi:TrkH family potassium uptake protein [Reinekea forsetii]|uniref:TrkH family potassium uptake protein n=1 Tax=Reinekea forsetii TaxID=1336806 RepID=UPI002355C718|nr:potassium transporter TrkG [Reinekea forsetii]
MVIRSRYLHSLVALSMLPLAIVGTLFVGFAYLSLFLFHDNLTRVFFYPGLTLWVLASFLWLLVRHQAIVIQVRIAPLFATLAWIITGLCSAIPIASVTGISPTGAIFESFSALTTTGATVLSNLDSMPLSFLMYRQFLQWLGGLGIVIFVVAVLPHLNVGGMKLLKAEVPGPTKDDKLVARTVNTAHYLWLVYGAITLLCALAYYLVGMSWFDAIAHSFSTVSTGGFSTHDASLGFFHSELVYLVSDLFMLMGAINFALHFQLFKIKNPRLYLENEEARSFLLIILSFGLLMSAVLLFSGQTESPLLTLNHAFFILISFITSTGFGAEDFTEWPLAGLFLLLISAYLGGCAGSTAGGSKIIRILILLKLVRREIQRLIHPHGVLTIRYQGRPVDDAVVRNTLAFIFFVILSSTGLTLLLMMTTGLDIWSAVSAVSACLNVLGPAFGDLSSNFQSVNDLGLALLSIAMVLGRLEYLTIIVLFMPKFWQY